VLQLGEKTELLQNFEKGTQRWNVENKLLDQFAARNGMLYSAEDGRSQGHLDGPERSEIHERGGYQLERLEPYDRCRLWPQNNYRYVRGEEHHSKLEKHEKNLVPQLAGRN
jgi:hypothetical protein